MVTVNLDTGEGAEIRFEGRKKKRGKDEDEERYRITHNMMMQTCWKVMLPREFMISKPFDGFAYIHYMLHTWSRPRKLAKTSAHAFLGASISHKQIRDFALISYKIIHPKSQSPIPELAR